MVFGFPDASFSQPRNVLLGHFLSSFIGLACLTLFGATWWSVAIAVGTAISVMMLTRTTHPPAGSNPVIIYLTKPTWSFLVFPTVFGAIVLICVALLYNHFTRKQITPVKATPILIRISCHNCNHNNPATFNFLTRCGTRLIKQHNY